MKKNITIQFEKYTFVGAADTLMPTVNARQAPPSTTGEHCPQHQT
jgi:hypothetical protein